MPELTVSEWDNYLSQYPDAHLLQTSAWGELKAAFGWETVRLLVSAGGMVVDSVVGAQVLFRGLPLGFSLAYIPKGPVGGDAATSWSDWETLWPEVDALCRKRKCIFLKVEPDLWESLDSPGRNHKRPELVPPGFQFSQQDIQPMRTSLVDLNGSEEKILGCMKQKTRYNIRLAQKKGVVVRATSDLETFHRLIMVTGQREAFGVHSLEYYRRAYELFHPRGECELLMAEYQGEPLAALMVFARGSRAYYFYGGSASKHRERMPNYLLQWEAMRWARAQGCTIYDLWGVPDVDESALEANFTLRSDGLWGVYRFKRGFGGHIWRASGPWDRVYMPLLYAFYRWWMARDRGV